MATFLIANDAMFMQAMLANMLENGGHEAIGRAGNGEELVRQYESLLSEGRRPDVVLTDIVMPVMDGIEAFGRIRQMDPEAVCGMVASMTSMHWAEEAVAQGADGVLRKPYEQAQVAETVARLAAAAERRSARRTARSGDMAAGLAVVSRMEVFAMQMNKECQNLPNAEKTLTAVLSGKRKIRA